MTAPVAVAFPCHVCRMGARLLHHSNELTAAYGPALVAAVSVTTGRVLNLTAGVLAIGVLAAGVVAAGVVAAGVLTTVHVAAAETAVTRGSCSSSAKRTARVVASHPCIAVGGQSVAFAAAAVVNASAVARRHDGWTA